MSMWYEAYEWYRGCLGDVRLRASTTNFYEGLFNLGGLVFLLRSNLSSLIPEFSLTRVFIFCK
jgi:hypothetical protein